MKERHKKLHHQYTSWLERFGVYGSHHKHTHKSYVSTTSVIAQVLIVSVLLSTAGMLLVVGLQSAGLFGDQAFTALSTRELSAYLLVFMSLYVAGAVLSLFLRSLVFRRMHRLLEWLMLLVVSGSVTAVSLYHTTNITMWLAFLSVGVITSTLLKLVFKNYSFTGLNFYVASTLSIVVGMVWGAYFLVDLEVSTVTRALILTSIPSMIVSLPSGFLGMLELYDVICKDRWRRLRHPYPKQLHSKQPFVSLHVPTYSEPPEVVIETLNSLSELHYNNYEVIVIDNNTKDEKLWKPVQAHCEKLGSKFTFIHKENMKGAKAGALNYIQQFCNPKTEILGVVDADYLADKLFLIELVGYFEDEKLGFIQTPHDYREWSENLFLKMCYWEYKSFFHTAMVSLNEREAGITVGTMCLIRKKAFEQAGGWSEWCVTEDSELAIRIHDIGYSSIYVDKTYGRGLIPESFEDYKKQRYRWTAGPVQEFRHYAGHFIGLSKRASGFTFIQRLFHLNHGLGNALMAFNLPLLIVGLATITSMLIHDEIVPVPIELWIAATVALFATPLLKYLLYRITIKATLLEMLEQAIAVKALSHTVHHASLRTAITGNAKWVRTNKFKTQQSYASALWSTKEEISVVALLVLFIIIAYSVSSEPGLATMLLIGIGFIAVSYLAAPVMAIIGVKSAK